MVGKPLVLMVEKGIDDFGGLQNDLQRIHFSRANFTEAAVEALRHVTAYTNTTSVKDSPRN